MEVLLPYARTPPNDKNKARTRNNNAPFEIPRRPIPHDKLGSNLLWRSSVVQVPTIQLGTLSHFNIGLDGNIHVGRLILVLRLVLGRLDRRPVRLQQLLVAPHLGVKTFLTRLGDFALPTDRGHEAASLLGLCAIRTRVAAITFDFALPTGQAGVRLQLCTFLGLLGHEWVGHDLSTIKPLCA